MNIPDWSNLSAKTQQKKILDFVYEYSVSSDFPDLRNRGELELPVEPCFKPCTESELLLLAVYFDAGRKGETLTRMHQDNKVSGMYRTIYNWFGIMSQWTPLRKEFDSILEEESLEHLQLLAEYEYIPGIRWVGFDPMSYQNCSPEEALKLAKSENKKLAGPEIIMAIALFPELLKSQFGMQSASLASLRFSNGRPRMFINGGSSVPCITNYPHSRMIEISRDWKDSVARGGCYCPTVRELG